MTDLTKTTALSATLSKFIRARYNISLAILMRLLDKEKPTSFSQVDSLFPKIGKEIDGMDPKLQKIVNRFVKQTYIKGKSDGTIKVSKAFKTKIVMPFNQQHKNALNQVNKMAFQNIKNINEQMKGDIRRELYESISNGESPDNLSKRLEGVFKRKPKKSVKAFQKDVRATPEFRAELIAKTELVRSYNAGTLQMLKQSGVKVKEWFTARDERVCPICAPMNGQLRPVDEPFEGKDTKGRILKVMHPTIHVRCRCTMLAKV